MRRAKGRGKRADMGMLVAETATRLRSGATPEGDSSLGVFFEREY